MNSHEVATPSCRRQLEQVATLGATDITKELCSLVATRSVATVRGTIYCTDNIATNCKNYFHYGLSTERPPTLGVAKSNLIGAKHQSIVWLKEPD